MPRTPELSVLLPTTTGVADLMELGRTVQTAGFGRVWLAEVGGPETAALGGALAATTGLEVGSAIVSAYSRTPALLAMMAATWSALGGHRPVHLGVGAGGQAIVERWHGIPFDQPHSTVQDSLRIIRQALHGKTTTYNGPARHSEGFRLELEATPDARLYVGGTGPKMVSLAAAQADGLIATWLSPAGLAALRVSYDDALGDAGRSRTNSRLLARLYVSVCENPERTRSAVREELVGYIVSPPYARFFRSAGFATEVAAVHEAFSARNRSAAVDAVADQMLDGLTIIGSSGSQIAGRLREYAATGVDELLIQPVSAALGGDPAATIRSVADVMGVTPEARHSRI